VIILLPWLDFDLKHPDNIVIAVQQWNADLLITLIANSDVLLGFDG
jgi:hypothetical protein